MAELGRVLTAMVTPFHDDGSLDMDQAVALARALLENGSDGLVVAGTTGESPTLEFEEERRLFRDLLAVAREYDACLVAGTGSNNTKTAIDASRKAEEIGVDALLLVVPYYNKPSQDGLYAHYAAIAAAVHTPCILYNVPGRTGSNMSADTQLRLARDFPGVIVGAKEACGDLDQVAQIIEGAPDGFRVWSGNDGDNLPILVLGGYGCISVISHLVGRQVKALYDAYLNGNREEAARIARRLGPLTKAMFLIGSPSPLKYALNHVGFRVGPTRLPLVEPPADVKAKIEAVLARTPIDLPLPAARA